ncbi:DNA-binding transcriptional ArsR family regulator [Paenibacillus mucilaginosus]|uniref:hypothetical protein n=1 Tax=Paenibacillus mucilaginosus TaxID=61624 RepID=UPI003D25F4CC
MEERQEDLTPVLTKGQAVLYEFLKTGKYTYKEMLFKTDIAHSSIRQYVRVLIQCGLVVRTERKGQSWFTAADISNEVRTSESILQRAYVLSDEDPLLRTLRIELNRHDLERLHANRHRPRSILAREFGMTRFQLNYALEQAAAAVLANTR